MKDDRTEEQIYDDWVKTVLICWNHGWKHAYGWVFYSPSGNKHDLSAADLTQLDRIDN